LRTSSHQNIDSIHQPIFLSAQVICPFMLDQGSGIFINITRYGNSEPEIKGSLLTLALQYWLHPSSTGICLLQRFKGRSQCGSSPMYSVGCFDFSTGCFQDDGTRIRADDPLQLHLPGSGQYIYVRLHQYRWLC